MNTRLARASLAAALAMIAGCSTAKNGEKVARQIEPEEKQEQAVAEVGETAQEHDFPRDGDLTPGTPDAQMLARKTESYVRSIEGAIAKRPTPKSPEKQPDQSQPQAHKPKPLARQESLVEWIDTSDFRIGLALVQADRTSKPDTALEQSPAMAQATPDTTLAIQAAPTEANQVASISEPPKLTDAANTPISIPAESKVDKASALITPGVDAFELRITRRAKDYPRDVSANLDQQLLMFLRDEPVPQLTSLSGLPTEDRELISAVMDGISNLRTTLRSDNNMLLSRKIKPITDLADRLRTQAELSIPTLLLCTKVDGFGRYDSIDPPRFTAQREHSAIIYCELENFSSKLNDAKLWHTEVTQEAILYTEDGMQVWADKTQKIQDTCRNRRHDFFLRTLVKLPGNLTVGRYMLKVTVVDQYANRVAESSLPIQIVAQ